MWRTRDAEDDTNVRAFVLMALSRGFAGSVVGNDLKGVFVRLGLLKRHIFRFFIAIKIWGCGNGILLEFLVVILDLSK